MLHVHERAAVSFGFSRQSRSITTSFYVQDPE